MTFDEMLTLLGWLSPLIFLLGFWAGYRFPRVFVKERTRG